MKSKLHVALVLLALSACQNSGRPAADQANVAQWVGQWNGPEGTTLNLSRDGESYAIKIRGLDGVESFKGTASEDRILFTRAGKEESIHAGSGKETRMKWLLDKKDCLIIKAGEGFCRD